MEAPIGIGPMIKVLQTSALPLGYGAVCSADAPLVYHMKNHLSMGKFQIFSDIFKIRLSLAISPPTGAKENSGHPFLPEFSPSYAPSLFFILWSLCPELPRTAHWFQRNAPHSAFLSAV